jgi:peptide/nickel transport system permease protein
MMGCFILITIAVVVSNFVVDLIYPVVDPRILKPASRKSRLTAPPPQAELPGAEAMNA